MLILHALLAGLMVNMAEMQMPQPLLLYIAGKPSHTGYAVDLSALS